MEIFNITSVIGPLGSFGILGNIAIVQTLSAALLAAFLVGTGARCAHGAHRLGQLHSFQPPIGPLEKITKQPHWHLENNEEMGIT